MRPGRAAGMTITVSEWFHEGVIMEGGVLAIDPKYFEITGGRERWLYRVARKHAGGADGLGFAVTIKTLFEKSGAEGSYRRFKFEMERVVERNGLPEFFLAWEVDTKTKEPRIRMTRRSELDFSTSRLRDPALSLEAEGSAGAPRGFGRGSSSFPAPHPPSMRMPSNHRMMSRR